MSAVDALTSLLKSAGVTDLRPIVLGAINLPDQAADLGEGALVLDRLAGEQHTTDQHSTAQ